MADKSVVRRRGGHRAQVTKLLGLVDQELCKDNPCVEVLSAYSDELTAKKTQIGNYDEKIQSAIEEEENLAQDIQDASKISIDISVAIKKISSFCSNNSSSTSNNNNNSSKFVKLPTLQLCKFSGNPLTWNQFWDIFNSSIHQRSDLSSAAKFQYLIGQLEGNAAHLLSGFNQTVPVFSLYSD